MFKFDLINFFWIFQSISVKNWKFEVIAYNFTINAEVPFFVFRLRRLIFMRAVKMHKTLSLLLQNVVLSRYLNKNAESFYYFTIFIQHQQVQNIFTAPKNRHVVFDCTYTCIIHISLLELSTWQENTKLKCLEILKARKKEKNYCFEYLRIKFFNDKFSLQFFRNDGPKKLSKLNFLE